MADTFLTGIFGERLSYSTDVLNCIANLSNDEVFTPPRVVKDMLDMLPQELFDSGETTFLDPACKSGVFLREIARRLLEHRFPGYEKYMGEINGKLWKNEMLSPAEINYKQAIEKAVEHIFKKQVFGIAITELTSLMSRRSLYCSMHPSGRYSVAHFDTEEGNIRFRRTEHTWEDGKCKFCGISEKSALGESRDASLETHAYEYIHITDPEMIFNMRFDVIISNPPYQLNIGVEKENYAIPIYQKFIEQAKKLDPRYMAMIIPARWYAGGRGLEEFREEMLSDDRLRIIHDFPDAADVFPGVQIKAGICYFLWAGDSHGDCSVTTHLNGKVIGPVERPLLEKGNTTFIRYNQAISIIKKVSVPDQDSFSKLVSPQTPFGIVTSFKGTEKPGSPTDVKMYISGNDRKYKGKAFYAPESMITKGHDMIPWHKIYINKAGSGNDSFPHQIIGKPFYGEPGTVCNQSYLVIGPFKDKSECENAMSYIATKFFRFMVLQKKNAQDAMRGVYQLVPMQDFSKPWTDEELYAKYGISDDEIAFIDSMIRPMDLDGGDD